MKVWQALVARWLRCVGTTPNTAVWGLTSKVTGADESPAMTCYAGRRPVDRRVRPQLLRLHWRSSARERVGRPPSTPPSETRWPLGSRQVPLRVFRQPRYNLEDRVRTPQTRWGLFRLRRDSACVVTPAFWAQPASWHCSTSPEARRCSVSRQQWQCPASTCDGTVDGYPSLEPGTSHRPQAQRLVREPSPWHCSKRPRGVNIAA